MKDYKYLLRFMLLPELMEDRIDNLIKFCSNAKIDDVMFFIGAEEYSNGHITKEEAEPYIRAIKIVKSRLNDIGITTSLNPWISLAHCDRGRKLKNGQNFTLMTDKNGRVADTVVCPTDEIWLNYFLDLYKYYIEEIKPDTIWIEDDFRLHNHEPLEFGGCFCNKHMKLYSDYLGEEIDRETFVKGLLSTQYNKRYRQAYIIVNRKLMLDVSKKIGTELNKYDIKLGLMTSDPRDYFIEGRQQENIFKVLSNATKKPLHRINLPSYRQETPMNYAWNYNIISIQSAFLSNGSSIIMPEIENFPHSPYSKSSMFSVFQIESSISLGTKGVTLSIFDFAGNGILDDWGYAQKLKKIKPFMKFASDLDLQDKLRQGIIVLIDEDASINIHTDKGNYMTELKSSDSWWAGYLGSLGIAFKYSVQKEFKDCVIAVSNQYFYNMTKEQIETLIENNFVLLDGGAVKTLNELGLLSIIEATSVIELEEQNGLICYEEAVEEYNLLGIKKARAGSQLFCGNFLDIKYTGVGKKMYSKNFDYNRNATADGICLINGKTMIMPFINITQPIGLLCPFREKLIKMILNDNVKSEQIIFSDRPLLIPYFYRSEENDYVVLTNFSDESYDNFSLTLNIPIKNISIADRESLAFNPCEFTQKDNNYLILSKIESLKSYLLKF